MSTLAWFTPKQRPDFFKPYEFDCLCAITDRYLLYIRPTLNGRFALSVRYRALGGQAYAKHYVSQSGAQSAAQRWLSKHEAVRV